jgi:ribonuclease-3
VEPELDVGHAFADPDLLGRALTHPSALSKGRSDRRGDYERLEFLGDRVLGLIVAELLFQGFPQAPEGDLAKRFNELVRRETLAEVAVEIGLPERIRMSEGERQTGGREKPAILADVCEAVIGALYLDGGIAAAQRFVSAHWADRIAGLKRTPRDPKTTLQEWAHAHGMTPPVYSVVGREGPDHAPQFTIRAEMDAGAAEARGRSKKETERLAAKLLLERLESGHG